MIPGEAVEAGLAAWADRKAVWPRDVVRHILEAAAPHLAAAVWDAGYRAGTGDYDYETENPYTTGGAL